MEELFAGHNLDLAEKRRQHAKIAADLGLAWGERHMTYNSRRAQELGKWAEAMGKGDEYHTAVFRAYFADGQNIADEDVLAGLAAAMGLDPAQARRVLARGLYAQAVDNDWERSRTLGVTAVPTFISRGRGVVGAQPYEILARFVQEARKPRQG